MREASSAREVTQRSHANYPNPNLNLQAHFALSFHREKFPHDNDA